MTVLVCLAMLYFLLKQAKKTASSRALVWLIFITTIWTVVEILASIGFIVNEIIHLYLWRSAFFLGGITTYSLLCFILTFFEICKKINFKIKLITGLVLGILSFYLTIISSGTVKNILTNRAIWEIGYETGQLFPLTVMVVGFPMLASLLFTLWKYFTAKNEKNKKQYGLMTMGIFSPAIGGVLTNLILPLLGIVHFPRLANFSSVILIGVLFYVIYELNAFKGEIKRYSIRFRLVIMVVAITFFGSLIGFFVYYSNSMNVLNQEVYRNFDSITQIKSYELQNFLNFQKSKLDLTIKSSIVIGELFNKVEQDEEYFAIMEKVKNKLNLISDKEIREIILLDKNGRIVAVSKNSSEEGKDYSQKEEYKNALNRDFISDIRKEENLEKYYFTISVPYFESQSNKFQGMIIGKIDAQVIENLLAEKIDLGDTGEIFLLNREKKLITATKYLGREEILNKKIETISSTECFTEKNKEYSDHKAVNKFLDYRNIEVIGTHAYIAQMNWCLVSKIDQKEITDKYEKGLSIIFFLSLIIIIIVSSLVAYFYSLTISRPIADLQDGAQELSRGNLDYKVEIDSRDEFGQLAGVFNFMGQKLKETYSSLEKKVKERTRELEKSITEMDNSRKAMLNILEDVDEEKNKTQEEKEKISAILHSIGDGVFVVDDQAKIIMINQVTSDISGFSQEELIGKRYDKILHFVQDSQTEKIIYDFVGEAIASGKTREMPIHTMLVRKDGEKIPVSDSAAPLKNEKNKVVGCVVVFRDIAKEYQVDKAKTEFVSLASHQLRTPLSAINWYTEMLLAGDAGELNKEQRSFMDEIYNGNQRMVELVNSLLNVSRIELGTLAIEPRPTDFAKISNNVVKELINEIKIKQLKVKENYAKNIPLINADPNLTRIIFQNIITNAVKYTPEKGKIDIILEKESKNLLIKISDTGYGIPDNQKDRIFQKLFRADNVREKDTNGSGLGLYLVKSIVEQSEGEIWFESKENKGTTFFVRIPLSGMKKKEGSKTLN
ncbi:MAG: Multi-sensor signal transduction histidine kinase [Candidatus Moranbacteria bacterium GW2011_GWF2_36_839]|nr:MAG: Multi-sensor signal transduction histidine kinase [Candidatus Moranbacteria bacterium GW2011_GWF1_36_78]KKQ17441.1 MAG: Multi-sensor signal transduction histidine kinase [Candidatus Moranbacteria bacterium GW2011_GWF2_36_839]